jgi:UDP-N-acetylglucosamine 1-carboxyvinyltransferase
VAAEALAQGASAETQRPHLLVTGGRRLSGELRVSGAKNSALVLMAACLLTREQILLRNVPPLTDIVGMGDMLVSLGGRVRRSADTLELDGADINCSTAPYELVNSLRASFFCIGPLLARMGMAKVPLPGGCHHRAWCGDGCCSWPQPSSQGGPHSPGLPQCRRHRNPDDGRCPGRR